MPVKWRATFASPGSMNGRSSDPEVSSSLDNEIQIPKAENTLWTRDRSISGPGRVGLGRHNG